MNKKNLDDALPTEKKIEDREKEIPKRQENVSEQKNAAENLSPRSKLHAVIENLKRKAESKQLQLSQTRDEEQVRREISLKLVQQNNFFSFLPVTQPSKKAKHESTESDNRAASNVEPQELFFGKYFLFTFP